VIIVVFSGVKGLMCIDTLDPNEAFTQGDFVSFVLSNLKKHAQNLHRRKYSIELAMHIDNSSRHNRHKVVDKMRRNHVMPLDHPPYSLDLSPGDFSLFGVLKNRIKETVFRNADEVEDFVCNSWSAVTLDEVQLAFQKWRRRLKSACEHDGEYLPE
jgi:hypothetical protein